MKKKNSGSKAANIFRRISSGIITGSILGIIAGYIEGQSIFSSLKGFNGSIWMLLLVPAIYGVIGVLYGGISGVIYHYAIKIFPFKKLSKDVPSIIGIELAAVFFMLGIVWINETIIYPRYHPISIALDILVLGAAFFLWRVFSFLFELLFKIKKQFIVAFILLIAIGLFIYNFSIYLEVDRLQGPPSDRLKEMRIAPVILIMIDTLRSDHLSCYGYDKPVSPVIDSLAAEGLLFENNYSSTSWTIPSHFSMMSGTTSGAIREEFSIADETLTMTERINLLGYRTASLSANPLLSEAVNFDQGFDLFDSNIHILNRLNNLQFFTLLTHLKIKRPIHDNRIKVFNSAELVTDYAIDWINRFGNEPYFLFINYMDAHDPYLPPAEYKKMFITDYKGKFTGDICGKMSEAEFIKYILPTMKPEDWHYVVSQYDGAIKYIDDQIGRIVKNLKNNDGFNNTIIIVTSDHGELFGEYNLATHHLTLSEEETHTPLIVHFPNAIKTPAKVKSLSRIIDIYPTLRDMIGFKMPDNVYMEGVPLIDFSGKPTVGATYVPMILYKNAYKASVLGPAFRRNLFSYRNQEWKYIFPDIDKDLNRASISKDIFRPEQIEEQLFKIDSNGRPEKKVTQKKEIMYEMYSSLFKWREIIKKEKPHLGNSKVSRKLIRELTDGNYIRPYNTY